MFIFSNIAVAALPALGGCSSMMSWSSPSSILYRLFRLTLPLRLLKLCTDTDTLNRYLQISTSYTLK